MLALQRKSLCKKSLHYYRLIVNSIANQPIIGLCTEFALPAGKVYLAPMIDCFDGMTVSWTLSASPDADLVNEKLDIAEGTLSEEERPVVHSDRGVHFRIYLWIWGRCVSLA